MKTLKYEDSSMKISPRRNGASGSFSIASTRNVCTRRWGICRRSSTSKACSNRPSRESWDEFSQAEGIFRSAMGGVRAANVGCEARGSTPRPIVLDRVPDRLFQRRVGLHQSPPLACTGRAEVYNEGRSPAKPFSANGETLLSRLSSYSNRGPLLQPVQRLEERLCLSVHRKRALPYRSC